MFLEILTPEETLFSGEVEAVRLPGAMGSFEVLNNHAPLISSLEKGQVRIKPTDGETQFIEVKGGFVEVLNNRIVVLV